MPALVPDALGVETARLTADTSIGVVRLRGAAAQLLEPALANEPRLCLDLDPVAERLHLAEDM
jgi:hypothetical protein